MRYYSSGHSHKEHKPKRKDWSFFRRAKTNRRRYKQYEEAAVLKYSNPFKTKVKKTRRIKLKGTILPLLLVSWIALLLYMPYFRVTSVVYTGLKIIKESEIEKIVREKISERSPIWPSNNYFILSDKAIAKTLEESYALSGITVTKVFPNKLNIAVQEKISSAVYDNGEAYYLIDENGYAIKYLQPVKFEEIIVTSTAPISTSTIDSSSSTPQTISVHTPNYKHLDKEYSAHPIIYDTSRKKIVEKDLLLSNDVMRGLSAFYNGLEKGREVKVRYFTTNGPGAGFTAVTNKQWKITFEPSKDIENQISNLQIFLKNSHPTEYVDIRYGDRIFWK